MRKLCGAFLIFVFSVLAANIKLYLKDGSYHVVREYSVKADRVRYYSVERSDWEEIPLELADLKRTEAESAQRKAALAEEAKILSEEDKAVRALEDEIARIPMNPGVYYLVNGTELKTLKQAESHVHGNKGRSVLKVLAPIPVVSGKATLELDKAHSLAVIENSQPEFYIQLAQQERFGIIRLTPQKGIRIVEKLTIIPVTNEILEQQEQVEVFRNQLSRDGLYKIWPAQPLEPGEYAVVEYTEGKLNIQIWDFSYKGSGSI